MKYIPRRHRTQIVLIVSIAIISIISCFVLIFQNVLVEPTQDVDTNAKPHQSDRYLQPTVDDSDSIRRKLVSGGNRQMRTNILFLKTHKTGSSTLQNILWRFGFRYSLNMMVPGAGNYIGYSEPLTTRSLSWDLWPTSRKFHIFACHSRYHSNSMKFMYNDTVRVTVLRNPARSFESLYNFFSLHKNFNLTFEQLVKSLPNAPVNFTRGLVRDRSTNQMCHDLGLTVNSMTADSTIQNFIRKIDREFNLVMITEYFDTCLVLLADLMNWPLEHVKYFPILARVDSRKYKVTREDEIKLCELNSADSLLYDYFVKRLRQRIIRYGIDRLIKDLRTLHKLNDDLHVRCVSAKTDRGFWGTVSYALKPNPAWECIYATKHEFVFLDEIRQAQIRRFAKERRLVDLTEERL